jgi:hypothetical protein
LSRILDPISDPFCLVRFGSVLLTASAANAAEPYRLEEVIGKPLKAAIEEFPGGAIISASLQLRRLSF